MPLLARDKKTSTGVKMSEETSCQTGTKLCLRAKDMNLDLEITDLWVGIIHHSFLVKTEISTFTVLLR